MSEIIDQQKLLDAFLVDNRELEELNARLANFNLFNVLKIAQAEIRHSNVLAWLLTPGATHGLSDIFFKRFMSRLLMENDSLDVSLTPSAVELQSFTDVEVLREWHSIDIFVKSRSANWCLLIENKVKSGESLGQLTMYKEVVAQEYPGIEIVPVYLTLEGEDPSEEGQGAGYISMSHALVLEILDKVTEQYSSRMPDDARVFVEHYRSILRRLTMQDQELAELCKAIYRKHREAIDLIVQYGASSKLLETIQTVVDDSIEVAYSHIGRQRVWFVPKEMATCQKPVLGGWKFLPKQFPIVWWYHYGAKRGRIQLTMEVGPLDDSALRNRLLEALQQGGFSFWEGAFEEGRKYTRILSETKKLKVNEEGEPEDDEEYIKQVVDGLWKKAWEKGNAVVGVLEAFNWES